MCFKEESLELYFLGLCIVLNEKDKRERKRERQRGTLLLFQSLEERNQNDDHFHRKFLQECVDFLISFWRCPSGRSLMLLSLAISRFFQE